MKELKENNPVGKDNISKYSNATSVDIVDDLNVSFFDIIEGKITPTK